MAHQVECSFIDEIGTANHPAIGLVWEKARAIDVLDIVCRRGGICQSWSVFCFGYDSQFWFFREADITDGVFDNGVSDVFVHPIPSPDITGPAKSALKQVFQRRASKVCEHYYHDKRA
jgi:hypothetical protein